MNTEIQDILRGIRKEFFAFRNGIVADKLRKAGDPHPMIMGCLLVDIQAIAMRLREELADNDKLRALAEQLWGDTNSRECRLAAPMLYPAHEMTQEKALLWCGTVETVEVADNLCHKLLRHLGEAPLIYKELIKRGRPTLHGLPPAAQPARHGPHATRRRTQSRTRGQVGNRHGTPCPIIERHPGRFGRKRLSPNPFHSSHNKSRITLSLSMMPSSVRT